MSFATPSGRPVLRSWPAPALPPVPEPESGGVQLPIARDLRLEVYRWVDEGQSDEQVIARMTERFGDFVRYDPLQGQHGAAVGPALLLLLALNRLRRSLHRRQPARVPLVGDRAEGCSPTTPEPS